MKLTDILLKEYEDTKIELKGEMILPVDKEVALQAEDKDYNRR